MSKARLQVMISIQIQKLITFTCYKVSIQSQKSLISHVQMLRPCLILHSIFSKNRKIH